MSVSFIVPTIGRSSLYDTLASIELWEGDEILVVGENLPWAPFLDRIQIRVIPCPRGNDWGHTERNYATPQAKGTHIAHIDDDDVYVPGVRALLESAISAAPTSPTIFRMQYPNGLTLWQEEVLRCGNVGTPMMLIPNIPEKLGRWEPFVGGDFAFLQSCKWHAGEYTWRPEVIALLGHNT